MDDPTVVDPNAWPEESGPQDRLDSPALPEPLQPDPSREADDLTCPECGRVFTNKQGLGRHLTVTHGRKPSRAKKSGGSTRKPKEQTTEALDASLLRALYPSGAVPVAAMPKVQAWLDEAHRLRS